MTLDAIRERFDHARALAGPRPFDRLIVAPLVNECEGHLVVPFGELRIAARSPLVASTDAAADTQNMWSRWGHEVERHPWRYFVGAATVLVVLAVPLFSMKLGFPDDGTAPTTETRRLAYDLLSEGFGLGFNGPLLLAVSESLLGRACPASAPPLVVGSG